MSAERLWKKPEGEAVGVSFIRPSKLAEEGFTGVILEGTFVESVVNHYDESKRDFKFEKDDGSIVIVNGAGNLAYRMSNVTVGDYIQLSYEGKQDIQSGKMKGKKAHNFSILIAE